MNYCLSQSVEKNLVEWSAIYRAEKEYSKDRLKGLYEEWYDIYPSLQYMTYILSSTKEIVSIEDLHQALSEDVILNLYQVFKKNEINDEVTSIIYNFIDENICHKDDVTFEVLSCFYRTGIIGISDNLPDSFDWSFRHSSHKSNFECSQSKWIKVHKMFHQALHIEQ
nr:hypothetical protein [Psychrobacter immobilis]